MLSDFYSAELRQNSARSDTNAGTNNGFPAQEQWSGVLWRSIPLFKNCSCFPECHMSRLEALRHTKTLEVSATGHTNEKTQQLITGNRNDCGKLTRTQTLFLRQNLAAKAASLRTS